MFIKANWVSGPPEEGQKSRGQGIDEPQTITPFGRADAALSHAKTKARILGIAEGRLSGKELAPCRNLRLGPSPVRPHKNHSSSFPSSGSPNKVLRKGYVSSRSWRPLSRVCRRARQGMDFPIPVQPQHAIDIFVTPSPPSDAGLSPPLASRQEGADLHFQIIAHFAEGTTGVADPEVVDPSGHDCVDPGNNHRHGGGAPAADNVPYLSFHGLSGLLLGGHLDRVSVLLPFSHAAQIKPEEPEGFALQHVDHFGLLAVELDQQGLQLLLQALQGPFGPVPLA